MAFFNDGGCPANTRKVSIYITNGASDASGASTWGTAKGIYVLENFDPVRPSYVDKRYDQSRNPSGAIGTDDFVEGSATAQLQYAATVELDCGDAFTTHRNGNNAVESFVVINVDSPETQGQIRKQTFRYQKLYYGPSGNWPPVF